MSNTLDKLDKEEKKLLKDFESGDLKPVKDAEKEKARYTQYARYTLSKSRNINIRISERDLRRIKALAAEKGLSYETFIDSLLHQYSSRKMREKVF